MEAKLVDYMGDDLRVVNAARVSFDKESEWEVTRELQTGSLDGGIQLSERDKKLINYLAEHNHWTPFSHVTITMREKVPIFVARQRFKHMVGFSYNEVSRRYVDDDPEFFHPLTWRKRAENKKQGSSEEPSEVNDSVDVWYEAFLKVSEKLYKEILNAGIAPEQARMVLPQSMYTEYYVTGSLAAWARAFNLRSDSHSQFEIQLLADQWYSNIAGIPELEHSWKALTKGPCELPDVKLYDGFNEEPRI